MAWAAWGNSGRLLPREAMMQAFADEGVGNWKPCLRAGFLSPPLTTVRVEREELGVRAVRCLLDRAATPAATPVLLELATRLIERQSVADAPPEQADAPAVWLNC